MQDVLPLGKGLQRVEEDEWAGFVVSWSCCYRGGTAGIKKGHIFFTAALGKTEASGKEAEKEGAAEDALG